MVREAVTPYRIMDLEAHERPRERMEQKGPQALTDAELLAILLRVGIEGENAVLIGTRLLKEMGGLRGLQQADFRVLCQQRGVGRAKAAQIKAALELGRRVSELKAGERLVISSPADAANLIKYEMSGLMQENLWVLLLDIRNQHLETVRLYQGSVCSAQVKIGEIFKAAIQRASSSIIIAHNHPTGDPSPSPDDVALTRAIVQAGKLMDIEVLDHLVIGGGNFVSLKERGLGF